MNVVCDVVKCPHKNGKFFGKEFTIINQAGQCNEFYMDNGAPREKPLFMYQQEYEEWLKNKEKEITTNDSKESNGERDSTDNREDNDGAQN